MAFRISTNAFQPGGNIPVNYAKEGPNKSPYLRWEGAPEGTKSFALLVEDPDVAGDPFCHWIIWNIPSESTELTENIHHHSSFERSGIGQGLNDYDEVGYGGPQPPQGERHAYVFRLYALKDKMELPDDARRKDFLAKIEEVGVLDRAEITGFYKTLRKRRVSAA